MIDSIDICMVIDLKGYENPLGSVAEEHPSGRVIGKVNSISGSLAYPLNYYLTSNHTSGSVCSFEKVRESMTPVQELRCYTLILCKTKEAYTYITLKQCLVLDICLS